MLYSYSTLEEYDYYFRYIITNIWLLKSMFYCWLRDMQGKNMAGLKTK